MDELKEYLARRKMTLEAQNPSIFSENWTRLAEVKNILEFIESVEGGIEVARAKSV